MSAVRFSAVIRFFLMTILAVTALFATSMSAQTSELFPEVDANVNLNPTVRLGAQVKRTRENGENAQVEFGGSIDFQLKPLVKLKEITEHDLNTSKSRLLSLTIGFHRLDSKDSNAPVNRVFMEATPNFPLKGAFHLSDRNRGELNFSNGALTWRYRNKISIQRTVRLGRFHPSPYVSSEFFYDSKYGKWSNTYLQAGVILPVFKHLQIDPYYEHQNNTGKRPNQQVNALGIILDLNF
jgi:Protein of unknown function (DUF2490)